MGRVQPMWMQLADAPALAERAGESNSGPAEPDATAESALLTRRREPQPGAGRGVVGLGRRLRYGWAASPLVAAGGVAAGAAAAGARRGASVTGFRV